MELSRSKYLIDRRTGTMFLPGESGGEPGAPIEFRDPHHEGRVRKDRNQIPEYPWMQKSARLIGLHGSVAVLHETQRKFTGRDLSNGKLLWEKEFPKNRSIERDGVLWKNDLYILEKGQAAGAVIGIDVDKGQVKFEWNVSSLEAPEPLGYFSNWDCYLAGDRGLVAQLRRSYGKSQIILLTPYGRLRYGFDVPHDVMCGIFVGDRIIFTATGYEHGLWAFDWILGGEAWYHSVNKATFLDRLKLDNRRSEAAVDCYCYDGEKLFLFSGADVACIEPRSGRVVWEQTVATPNKFETRTLSNNETETYWTRFENLKFFENVFSCEFAEFSNVTDSNTPRW